MNRFNWNYDQGTDYILYLIGLVQKAYYKVSYTDLPKVLVFKLYKAFCCVI